MDSNNLIRLGSLIAGFIFISWIFLFILFVSFLEANLSKFDNAPSQHTQTWFKCLPLLLVPALEKELAPVQVLRLSKCLGIWSPYIQLLHVSQEEKIASSCSVLWSIRSWGRRVKYGGRGVLVRNLHTIRKQCWEWTSGRCGEDTHTNSVLLL